MASRVRRRLQELPRASSDPQNPVAAIVFDALEPRILLNAEVLAVQLATLPNQMANHDLLIQAVEQTQNVAGQTQTVQRVEVLDQSDNGAVLALGDLSSVKAVAISGNAGNDTVTLDLNSFGANTVPKLSFSGGTGQNSLVIDHASAVPLTWQVDGAGGGNVSANGTSVATFAGVQSITGSGADTLDGPSANTAWTVTGPGSGTVAATAFAGFSFLQGAANNDDTFTISGDGQISGGIDGGAGGYDSVVLDATAQSNVALTAATSSSGTVSLDGVSTAYSGMEPVTVNGTVSTLTLSLTADNTTATLGSNGNGQLALQANTAETQTFNAPTTSLTILLDDNSSTLTVDPLTAGFDASLSLQQGSSDSGDTIDFSGAVATGGQALSANADTINVLASATVDTRATTGTSGAITLSGQNLSLASGSSLLADKTSGATAGGAIALNANDVTYRTVDLPVTYSPTDYETTTGITLDHANISGGDISLDSDASDLSAADTVPGYVQGLVGNLQTIASQIPGEIVSELTGIDASVVLRSAGSTISLAGGSAIASSGTVNVSSNAATSSLVQAIATDFSGPSSNPVQVAAGYSQSSAGSSIDITGDSSISASGDITVLSNGSTDATADATASSSSGQSSKDQPAGIAVAITYTQLSATANLDNGSSITSTGGSVNFNATGTTTNEPDANVNGFNNGKSGSVAGVSAALGYDAATVTSTVNGAITATGTQTTGGNSTGTTQSFKGDSAGTVNLSTSTLDLPGNRLAPGDQVTYTANTISDPTASALGVQETPATPIGGLTSGATYYALPTDSNDVQLANAPVIAVDGTGTNANSTQTLGVVTALNLDFNAIDSSNNTIYLAGNGFNTGDQITYTAHGNTPIAGLTSGDTYTVNAVDGSDFQLKTSSGQVVAISQGSALGLQTFTDGTNVQTLNLATVSGNLITTAASNLTGLTSDATVAYEDLAGASDGIGGLTAGTTYIVHKSSPTTFEFLDANNNPIALTTPAGPGTQEFGYVSQSLTFNPSTGVSATTGEITVPSTANLSNGAEVIYQTDPLLSTTIQVPVKNGTTMEPDITVTVPDAAVGGLSAGGVYYLVVVDATHVRLASSLTDALDASPIQFTSLGSGNADSLAGTTYTDGIGVTASLNSTDQGSASPSEGSPKYTVGAGSSLTGGVGVSLAFLLPGASAALPASETPLTEAGGAVESSSSSDGFDGAGGVVFNYADHTVAASVGTGTTGEAVLSTPQSVNVAATILESEQSQAQASAARPSDSSGKNTSSGSAGALSIAVTLMNNSAEATAGENATIDAGAALTISSDVEYPFLTPLSDLLGGITSASGDYGLQTSGD